VPAAKLQVYPATDAEAAGDPADYDGDGKADLGVFRTTTGSG
jgi:hypothetical protein